MHRIRLIVAVVAVVALAAGAVLAAAPTAVAAPPPAAAPVIMNSIVLGGVDDPHVYISGEGFGDAPPPAYRAGRTRCGFNGWSNGGWFVDHWSHDYVVIHLGSAYGTRAGWQVQHGDTYVVTVRGAVGRGRIDLL